MFDPDYMEIQGACSACSGCAVCATCSACLADGPIPDFEGFGVSLGAGVALAANW